MIDAKIDVKMDGKLLVEVRCDKLSDVRWHAGVNVSAATIAVRVAVAAVLPVAASVIHNLAFFVPFELLLETVQRLGFGGPGRPIGAGYWPRGQCDRLSTPCARHSGVCLPLAAPGPGSSMVSGSTQVLRVLCYFEQGLLETHPLVPS